MKKVTGFNYLIMALLAFGGIGLEVLLAFLIEPAIYGTQMAEWTTLQNIIHWITTCILWGLVSVILIKKVKKDYGFDILAKGTKVKVWQWILVVFLVVVSLIISYIDWNGSKIVREFYANGWLKFIFQYIYYVFETVLVLLILVFGQKAFECWFKKENIPYGGIIVSLTWGVGHFFTKDLMTGIMCMILGLGLGSVYLLVNRDIRKAYPILFIMFAL